MKVFLVWTKLKHPDVDTPILGDICGSLEIARERRLEIIDEKETMFPHLRGRLNTFIEVKLVNNGKPTSTGCYDCRGTGLNCENCNSLK